jgi:hypothetical protein
MGIEGSDILLSARRAHRHSLGIRRLHLVAFLYLGSNRSGPYHDILMVVWWTGSRRNAAISADCGVWIRRYRRGVESRCSDDRKGQTDPLSLKQHDDRVGDPEQ